MTKALIYYYFNLTGGKVYEDLAYPIILAIANFRHFDRTTPVYVLDTSPTPSDWSHFPQTLHFTVVPQEPYLKTLITDDLKGYWSLLHLLSKPINIYHFCQSIPEELIVVSDCDLFFIRHPFPLMADYKNNFCCGGNTGFWYFLKQQPQLQVLLFWSNLCRGAAVDLITHRTNIFPPYGLLQEENVWAYILNHENKSFAFSSIMPITHVPWEENAGFHGSLTSRFYMNAHKIKAVHFYYYYTTGLVQRHQRGLFPLYIQEISRTIDVLPDNLTMPTAKLNLFEPTEMSLLLLGPTTVIKML